MLLDETFTLANNVLMPKIAIGTFRISKENECINAVKWALNAGYKAIDTADIYRNHSFIGKALKELQIDRHKIFITTKMWDNSKKMTKAKTIANVKRFLRELQIDYLDLLLIHWPNPNILVMWEAFEELYKNKKVRAIGVSNFSIEQLETFNKQVSIKPMVNQIQLNLNTKRTDLVKYCQAHNIVVTSWQTINEGKLLNDPQILDLASKYHTSTAQICFKWALQNNLTILPKSVHQNRIIQNAKLDDFIINTEDMSLLNERPDTEPVKVLWIKYRLALKFLRFWEKITRYNHK